MYDTILNRNVVFSFDGFPTCVIVNDNAAS